VCFRSSGAVCGARGRPWIRSHHLGHHRGALLGRPRPAKGIGNKHVYNKERNPLVYMYATES